MITNARWRTANDNPTGLFDLDTVINFPATGTPEERETAFLTKFGEEANDFDWCVDHFPTHSVFTLHDCIEIMREDYLEEYASFEGIITSYLPTWGEDWVVTDEAGFTTTIIA